MVTKPGNLLVYTAAFIYKYQAFLFPKATSLMSAAALLHCRNSVSVWHLQQMILCPSLCPKTILAEWHHHSRGIAISPLFFSLAKELWLLCWWVIHILERDAQIPETSYYCCIKCWRADRVRGDKSRLKKIQEMRAKPRSLQFKSTRSALKWYGWLWNFFKFPILVFSDTSHVSMLNCQMAF